MDLIKNNQKDLVSTSCVEFYFITPPGSEQALLQEISPYVEKLEISEKVEKGGVSCQLPLDLGLSLNAILKIPVRILLRLSSFKARDLPKFYKKISSLEWGKIFFDQRLEAHITASKCRLIHTDKLAKAFKDGVQESRRRSPAKKSSFVNEQRLWIRGLGDQWLLSLDTTGEPLYKRGEKKFVGNAPLRENLAAFLLQTLKDLVDKNKNYTLLDPMAGSGTFLLEALTEGKKIERNFSFHETKLAKYKKELEYQSSVFFSKFIGIERDESVFRQLKTNLSKNTDNISLHYSSFEEVEVNNEDEIILMINPPYGKRISLPKPAKEYYPKLYQTLKNNFKPKVLGMLVPSEFSLSWGELKPCIIKKVANGGIELDFCIWMAKIGPS